MAAVIPNASEGLRSRVTGDPLVGEVLEEVRAEGILIPQDVVVGGAGCALDAGMAHQEKIMLRGVRDH